MTYSTYLIQTIMSCHIMSKSIALSLSLHPLMLETSFVGPKDYSQTSAQLYHQTRTSILDSMQQPNYVQSQQICLCPMPMFLKFSLLQEMFALKINYGKDMVR